MSSKQSGLETASVQRDVHTTAGPPTHLFSRGSLVRSLVGKREAPRAAAWRHTCFLCYAAGSGCGSECSSDWTKALWAASPTVVLADMPLSPR